jgi:hypothetical protein
MDIIAHGLWAGLGACWLSQRQQITVPVAVSAVGLSVAPDVVHLIPVAIWTVFGAGTTDLFLAYVTAMPGQEPNLPEITGVLAHHLHCILHSAIVALAVTGLLWPWRKIIWLPLAGWWLHIVIDVFTHSAEFYPVPVLYPFTYQGFDGLAWNTPWFIAMNYAALVLAGVALWRRNP